MSEPADRRGQRQTMVERYGERPPGSRRLTVAVVVVMAGLALAWLAWAAWSQADREVGANVRSFDVVSPREVEVLVDIHRAGGAGVRCDVSARAEDHTTVGEDELVVAPGNEQDVRLTVTLRTSRRASVAIVDNCRPLT